MYKYAIIYLLGFLALCFLSTTYASGAESRSSVSENKLEKATLIVPATPFYRAEKYHQDYYKKNPLRYKIYRYGSGRDDYLVRKWGKK